MNKKKKRRRKKNNPAPIILLLAVCVVIIIGIVFLAGKLNSRENAGASENSQAEENIQVESTSEDMTDNREASSEETDAPYEEAHDTEAALTPTPAPAETPWPLTALSPDTIESLYGYMVRVSDGTVVLDKNSQEIMYPASMTKIMTALVAIELLPDPEERFYVSSEIIDPLYEENASMAGFAAGEMPTVRELLYGVLLPSGAEACQILAVGAAGSEEAFVELMNQKAQELGLENTHFVNTTGLHDDNHYTTCRDMARLLEYALQNETFYSIITAREYRCTPDEYYEDGLYMQSTMFKYLENDVMSNGFVIQGGKTGTTNEAGYCLASFGTLRNERFILVTGLGYFNEEGIHINITDAVSAYSALK